MTSIGRERNPSSSRIPKNSTIKSKVGRGSSLNSHTSPPQLSVSSINNETILRYRPEQQQQLQHTPPPHALHQNHYYHQQHHYQHQHQHQPQSQQQYQHYQLPHYQMRQFNQMIMDDSSDFNYTISESEKYMSEIGSQLINSTEPLRLDEDKYVHLDGESGIMQNLDEVINNQNQKWTGKIPLTEYAINEDLEPQVLRKKTCKTIEYIQEVAVRYLRPQTPPKPGDIIIKEMAAQACQPAPPIIIRQQPARPVTPEPLVIREQPPLPPVIDTTRKLITISGKQLPPPPRKVIFERFAKLPQKPQSVLVERWLPYPIPKRRVIHVKPAAPHPPCPESCLKPRNIIIQWESPQVAIRREFKYLGVIRADPAEYIARFGTSLIHSPQLPNFVLDIKSPQGLKTAAEQPATATNIDELYGDLEALKLVDLEREGLGHYRSFLESRGIISSVKTPIFNELDTTNATNVTKIETFTSATTSVDQLSSSVTVSLSSTKSGEATTATNNSATSSEKSFTDDELIYLGEKIFMEITNHDLNARISYEDAARVLLSFNAKLTKDRFVNEAEFRAFFSSIDKKSRGTLGIGEFKEAFIQISTTKKSP